MKKKENRKLYDLLIKENAGIIDNILHICIDDYTFFYYKLNNKECFCVCLNKPLTHLSDIKIMNKKCKGFAKFKIDNISFKNDLLYIFINLDYDVNECLKYISEMLSSLHYFNRSSCIVCGKKADLLNYKNALLLAHKPCIDKLIVEDNMIIDRYNKYYRKSFSLAILASFIAIIPSIILSFILGSYSIISSLLMFLPSFLSLIMFYKTPIDRTKKLDFTVFIISFSFVIIYHLMVILMFTLIYQIKSLDSYIKTFNYLIIESIVESIIFYFIGFISCGFIIKKPLRRRFYRQK